MVVDLTRAHLLQRKIVQPIWAFIPPTSVSKTYVSKRWTITTFLCAKVDYDTTDFREYEIWCRMDYLGNLCNHFNVKNIYIQLVKRSGNNTAICLARLFIF